MIKAQSTLEKLAIDRNILIGLNEYEALTTFDAINRMNIMTRINGYIELLETDATYQYYITE